MEQPPHGLRRRWVAEPGSELARLRQECHRVFDPLWDFGIMTRQEVYRRLARALGVHQMNCHFGMFDEQLCRRALSLRATIVED